MGRSEINQQYRNQIAGVVNGLLAAGWSTRMIAAYRNCSTSCVASWKNGASSGTHEDRDDLRLALGAPKAASIAIRLAGQITRMESAVKAGEGYVKEAKEAKPGSRAWKQITWETDLVKIQAAFDYRACHLESKLKSSRAALKLAVAAAVDFKVLVGSTFAKAVR
jgi:hypothetical protein